MLVSTEKEQISMPLDSLNGFPAATEMCDPVLVPVPVDVSVVPEQEKQELEHSISILEGEIGGLRLKHRSLDRARREALNKMLDIRGSIRVFCRVRPVLLTDRRRIGPPISAALDKILVRSGKCRKEFGFDKVFPPGASQEDVFVEVEPILRSALDGHNVCILAYGQTGTGKTFTMDGTHDHLGIVPRALIQLFHCASLDKSSSYTFSMSMLEVYMGSLRDLLAPKPFSVPRCNLNIQTDPKGLVEIDGLSEVPISDFTKASWWYSKGRRVRSTSWTNVNEASSRSHCLTRITIFRRGDASKAKAEVSKMWMVDLGGSERLLKTGATGQTLDEGRAINLSLSALGDVIAALRRKRGHVPYRNSKLTQILKDSLGDGSKILMLVHVSPFEEDVGETTHSLSFAKRARAVESMRELPEDIKNQKEKRIAKLEEEMREAEEECQRVRKQIQKSELLLNENKRLFSSTYQSLEEEGKAALRSPKEDLIQVSGTSLTLEKTIRRKFANSVPRFMNSTVASRQRLSAAEKEIDSRTNSSKMGTRSSIQFYGSQSLSYSELRFKAILRNSNKKSRYGANNTSAMESPKCCDLDCRTTSMPQSKILTSSNPNLRVTLSRHRRRMSDFV